MANGTPLKQLNLAESWDAIVIGSGIGGLTAAVLLARHAGKRVLVLERHTVAGGFTHAFRRPGFDWDVGVHYIGEVQDPASVVRRAFDHVTGGNLHWAPMPEVYDRVLMNGRTFDFVQGEERLRANLIEAFPSETAAIDGYFKAVRAVNKASGLYYAEKAVPGPIAAILGGLFRRSYMKWASQTTAQVLGSLTRNPELKGILSAQWGDYGLPPGKSSFAMHATVVAHYFNGGSYPVGGSASIAASMVPHSAVVIWPVGRTLVTVTPEGVV